MLLAAREFPQRLRPLSVLGIIHALDQGRSIDMFLEQK